MLIVGAKGHAKEMIEVLRESSNLEFLYFFDNVSLDIEPNFYGFPILKSFDEVKNLFRKNRDFSLGIGNPNLRCKLTANFRNLGGKPISVISNKALVAANTNIGEGVNIMPFASMYNNTTVGEGTLVNSYASVHHDAFIGEFCELSPGSRILGGCRVGKLCSIGTNAVVLPGVNIADHVIIGAGSVVTKNISAHGVYYGVPATKIK